MGFSFLTCDYLVSYAVGNSTHSQKHYIHILYIYLQTIYIYILYKPYIPFGARRKQYYAVEAGSGPVYTNTHSYHEPLHFRPEKICLSENRKYRKREWAIIREVCKMVLGRNKRLETTGEDSSCRIF